MESILKINKLCRDKVYIIEVDTEGRTYKESATIMQTLSDQLNSQGVTFTLVPKTIISKIEIDKEKTI